MASLRIPRRTTPVLARKSAPPAATPDKGRSSPRKTPKSSGKKKTPKSEHAASVENPRKSTEKEKKKTPEREQDEEQSVSILESAVKTPKSKDQPKKKSSSNKKKNRAENSPKPSTSRGSEELSDPFEGIPSFLDASYKGAKAKASKGTKAKVTYCGFRAVTTTMYWFFFSESPLQGPRGSAQVARPQADH